MKFNIAIILSVVFVIVFLFSTVYLADETKIGANFAATLFRGEDKDIENKDSYRHFVDCLAKGGVIFYGISEDSLTKKQIEIFRGVDIDDIFIECSEERTGQLLFECQKQKVVIFPTWVIDEERREEFLSVEMLQKITNCSI